MKYLNIKYSYFWNIHKHLTLFSILSLYNDGYISDCTSSSCHLHPVFPSLLWMVLVHFPRLNRHCIYLLYILYTLYLLTIFPSRSTIHMHKYTYLCHSSNEEFECHCPYLQIQHWDCDDLGCNRAYGHYYRDIWLIWVCRAIFWIKSWYAKIVVLQRSPCAFFGVMCHYVISAISLKKFWQEMKVLHVPLPSSEVTVLRVWLQSVMILAAAKLMTTIGEAYG